jgi:hypothetical protein
VKKRESVADKCETVIKHPTTMQESVSMRDNAQKNDALKHPKSD